MSKKNWSKTIVACLLASALSMGTTASLDTDDVRVIP